MLSPNPARRAVERYWLLYTPIWGIATALIMISGVAERWGDFELMIFGVALATFAVVPPIVRPHASERPIAWHDRTALKLSLSVTLFAFLMNYFCTPYFFDVLHMHYGFRASILIDDNPIFLYFTTVAYFATYFVLVCAAYRVARRFFPRWPWIGGAIAAFSVAALETALNANPFMRSLFCYDDMTLALSLGTLSYGACFVFALPAWIRIDERDTRTPITEVVVAALAAVMMIVVTFELLRYVVAPHLTIVETGAENLRDFGESCLRSPDS